LKLETKLSASKVMRMRMRKYVEGRKRKQRRIKLWPHSPLWSRKPKPEILLMNYFGNRHGLLLGVHSKFKIPRNQN
jgi:hypothetical protein